MSTQSRICRGVLLLVSAVLLAFAGVGAAERVGPRGYPGPAHGGPGYGASDADIQIYSDYESEYWRSNYRPDDYRLDGYDGEPERATICRGESGRTLSTRAIECPEGQTESAGGRRWSTSP